MTKIDIVSGFLGAGKTTLIKKLLKEALAGEQVVLIENEFGEIGIDGGFLKEAGIEIKEMNSGCICCSLVGDFGTSLKEVLSKYTPDRILIEPSGVGKLSDVMKAVEDATQSSEVQLGSAVAVVDAKKCKVYLKNVGEFFAPSTSNGFTLYLSSLLKKIAFYNAKDATIFYIVGMDENSNLVSLTTDTLPSLFKTEAHRPMGTERYKLYPQNSSYWYLYDYKGGFVE
jgi:G3E family GTPase